MNGSPPLIVGAGPAGTAAAIHLLRAGVQSLVIERRAPGTDPLCGGFLSWRTIEQLEGIGLNPGALGAQSISTLRVFRRDRHHDFPLPAPAMALSRNRLDQALLEQAEANGAEVRRDTAVFDDGIIHLADGERIAFDCLFLATGKHDLHGLNRPRDYAGQDPLLGLRMRLPASDRLRRLLGHSIEVHLFRGGYLGVVLQEDGSANFCMAVRKSRLTKAGGQPASLFTQLANDSAALAERLADLAHAPRIDAIGHVPYGWRATTSSPGIFRLGDQAGVIPSFAGEGIGIALASAEAAVHFWREGGQAAAPLFQSTFARRLRRPFAFASLVAAAGMHPLAGLPLGTLGTLPKAAGVLAGLTRI